MESYNGYPIDTGKMLRDDGTGVNIADLLVTIANSLTGGTATGGIKTFVFQNAVTTTGQGNTLDVGSYKNLSIDIYGTATARTVQFFSISASSELVPLMGFNTSSGELATSTSRTATEKWTFEITNLNKIVINVSAISGGNLTVSGVIS